MGRLNIVLIDPALKTNDGLVSDNLGDCIISESIQKELTEIFPSEEVVRVSPHVPFLSKEKKIINNSNFAFVGGTNILTSNVRHFPRLSPNKIKGFYLSPGIKNLILVGAGWNQYDLKPDWATKIFYKKILHRKIKHSLRETYSVEKLSSIQMQNILFTGCPTTWHLDTEFNNQFHQKHPVLCTLTDYSKDVKSDSKLLRKVFDITSQPVYFFPQGSEDISYLRSLAIYQSNVSKFKILTHDYKEFKNFVSSVLVNYIGTRLHAGIKCLNSKSPALIIGIDNRAIEMGKDLNLAVIKRSELDLITSWASEKKEQKIKLPLQNIAEWKNQFLIN
jgi:hypothetical protein